MLRVTWALFPLFYSRPKLRWTRDDKYNLNPFTGSEIQDSYSIRFCPVTPFFSSGNRLGGRPKIESMFVFAYLWDWGCSVGYLRAVFMLHGQRKLPFQSRFITSTFGSTFYEWVFSCLSELSDKSIVGFGFQIEKTKLIIHRTSVSVGLWGISYA